MRYAGDSRPGGAIEDPAHPARARAWVRVAGELPDDPVLHQAALAYTSDLTLIGVSVVPHGVVIGYTVQAASLDHAMWFHRPFRADRWLLYDQVSPSASGGLGLATGRLFQDGRLVATVAQEGLIRPRRDRKSLRPGVDACGARPCWSRGRATASPWRRWRVAPATTSTPLGVAVVGMGGATSVRGFLERYGPAGADHRLLVLATRPSRRTSSGRSTARA